MTHEQNVKLQVATYWKSENRLTRQSAKRLGRSWPRLQQRRRPEWRWSRLGSLREITWFLCGVSNLRLQSDTWANFWRMGEYDGGRTYQHATD